MPTTSMSWAATGRSWRRKVSIQWSNTIRPLRVFQCIIILQMKTSSGSSFKFLVSLKSFLISKLTKPRPSGTPSSKAIWSNCRKLAFWMNLLIWISMLTTHSTVQKSHSSFRSPLLTIRSNKSEKNTFQNKTKNKRKSRKLWREGRW